MGHDTFSCLLISFFNEDSICYKILTKKPESDTINKFKLIVTSLMRPGFELNSQFIEFQNLVIRFSNQRVEVQQNTGRLDERKGKLCIKSPNI